MTTPKPIPDEPIDSDWSPRQPGVDPAVGSPIGSESLASDSDREDFSYFTFFVRGPGGVPQLRESSFTPHDNQKGAEPC